MLYILLISFALTICNGSILYIQRMNRWLKTDRHDVFETFRHRHKIAVGSTAAVVANSAIFFKTRCVPMPAYAAVNGTCLFLLFSGYVNPEIMMR